MTDGVEVTTGMKWDEYIVVRWIFLLVVHALYDLVEINQLKQLNEAIPRNIATIIPVLNFFYTFVVSYC